MAGGVGAPAQEGPPTFAAQVELVTVDAVVLDKEGRAVPGLTRDDFVVKEDGRPREIATFEAFTLKALGVTPLAASPVASNAVSQPGLGRAFALILDDMSMGLRDVVDTSRQASIVLERSLQDGDDVVLATTSGDAWWTARLPDGRNDLLALVARTKARKWADQAAPDWLSDYEAFAIANERDSGRGAISRVIARLGNAGICPPGSPLSGGQPCEALVKARALEVDAARRSRTRRTLNVIRRTLSALEPIHGRKSVLLFSPGFVDDPASATRDVVAASREANAAVYFIDVRGLFTGQADASWAGPLRDAAMPVKQAFDESELASLGSRALAEETGGFSVRNTNDLATAAGKIVDESRVYYLLGFHPAEGTPAGEWRKLQIAVARKGLTVRARRGYTLRVTPDKGVDGPSRNSKANRGVDPAVSQALDSLLDATGISLRAVAYVFEPRPKKTAHVVVVVELDGNKITFEPKGHTRVAHLEVAVMVENRDTAQSFQRDGDVAIEVGGSGPPGWRSLAREFDLPAGVTLARVVVRDKTSGIIGSVAQRFEIPEAGILHLSTPILTDRLAPTAKSSAGPGLRWQPTGPLLRRAISTASSKCSAPRGLRRAARQR